jgi:signal transduction histidine kinase
MRDVIRNVVANAVEALSGNPGAIDIRTSACRLSDDELRCLYPDHDLPGGDYVSLEVADTGCGISPEIAHRIFDPFFTTKFTGRGLGLSAVQGIVRAHRGGIRVQTEVGRGTRIEIVFPCETAAVTHT